MFIRSRLLLGSILALILAGCATPTPAGASLAETPKTATLTAGAGSQPFAAALLNSTATISWALNPNVGTLSSTTGAAVVYTPPVSVASPTVIVLTATAGTVSDTAVITVNPAGAVVSGTLSLNIFGPASATFKPNIQVSGVGGFSQTVANFGLQSLSVPVGSASVTVKDVPIQGTSVDTVYKGFIDINGNPTTNTYNIVQGTPAQETINYNDAGFSGKVWINFNSTTTKGLSDQQISGTSGTLQGIDRGTGTKLQGMAFDKKGNLWVADDSNEAAGPGTIKKFLPNGTLDATITSKTLTNAATQTINRPRGLAFDSGGNLWVAHFVDSTIVRFDAATVANASGTNAFDSSVFINTVTTAQWEQIAFDAAGNLWAADFAGAVYQFPAGQLTSNPNPSIKLGGGTPNTFGTPLGLAFDKDGNLWIADVQKGVLKFSPAPVGSGNPNPNLTITATGAGGILSSPSVVAFDKVGNTWVGDQIGLRSYSVAQLAGQTGAYSSTPAKTFTVGGFSRAIAFFSTPTNLPIFQ